MDFNKLLLGESELLDFEYLLLREKLIDSVETDLQNFVDINEAFTLAKSKRIMNKKRLLILIMLFEKIDATSISSFDLTRFVELGIIDSDAYVLHGSNINQPTSKLVDNMLQINRIVISHILGVSDSLFKSLGLLVYSKSYISEENLLALCYYFWFGSKSDFYYEYVQVLKSILKNYYKKQYSDMFFYGNKEFLSPSFINSIEEYALGKLDFIYERIHKENLNYLDVCLYKNFTDKLEGHIQKYSVSDICLSCDTPWTKCCENSEFLYNCNFQCYQRERLGEQRYAKLNGLVLSQTNQVTLFDNSIKFSFNKADYNKMIENIYYIVNVDMSSIVSSLPIPQTVNEALRLRKRDEIQSYRNIFLKWTNCLYNGEIDAAEYIKKDFDAAKNHFEKKNSNLKKKKSIWHCCFEAAGNQIPYLSNLLGIVSPFIRRKEIIDEEKHKWLLLTR